MRVMPWEQQYKYKNKFYKIGSCKHSDISTFSMHPLKTITSGEGGIITTNNAKISKNIKLYTEIMEC
jgi:dTDP-4-amino-4,6-dideoxygalactose transaminase